MKVRLLRASWFVCLLTAAGLILTSDQQDLKYTPLRGILELHPDTKSVTDPITGILWKHGRNKVAEWDQGFGPDVDYYGTYKDRTDLNNETVKLIINNMTIEDSGIYSVEVNGRLLNKTYKVQVIKRVPKPLVAFKPCTRNSTNCTLVCIEVDNRNITDSGPVTYRWKKDEGEWMVSDSGQNSNQLIIFNNEEWKKVEKIFCEMKNMFSVDQSDPRDNLLYKVIPTVIPTVIPDTLAVSPQAPPPVVPEGSDITLSCNVTSQLAHPTYLSVTWSLKKGSAPWDDILTFGPQGGVDTGHKYAQRYADGGVRLVPRQSGSGVFGLVVSGASAADEGTYACTGQEWTHEDGGQWRSIVKKRTDMGPVAVTPTEPEPGRIVGGIIVGGIIVAFILAVGLVLGVKYHDHIKENLPECVRRMLPPRWFEPVAVDDPEGIPLRTRSDPTSNVINSDSSHGTPAPVCQ